MTEFKLGRHRFRMNSWSSWCGIVWHQEIKLKIYITFKAMAQKSRWEVVPNVGRWVPSHCIGNIFIIWWHKEVFENHVKKLCKASFDPWKCKLQKYQESLKYKYLPEHGAAPAYIGPIFSNWTPAEPISVQSNSLLLRDPLY